VPGFAFNLPGGGVTDGWQGGSLPSHPSVTPRLSTRRWCLQSHFSAPNLAVAGRNTPFA